jgi:diacylglycerol O-acyltransferase / wax synthase
MSDEIDEITDVPEWMSDSDAAMYLLDQVDPGLRTSGTAVILLDRLPDRERLLERFDLLSRKVPRMRGRVVSSPLSGAPPRFVQDRPFDIRFHVRFSAMPEGSTINELLEMGAVTQMQDFDRARPLWWVQVVSGLEGGGAGLIYKFNHAIADAVGGMTMFAELFDLKRQAKKKDDAPPQRRESVDPVRHWLDATRHETQLIGKVVAGAGRVGFNALRHPQRAARMVASMARVMKPVGDQLSPILRGRALMYHFEVLTRPMEPLKQVGRANGGKLNDAFVAAIGEGMRLYHEHHGAPVDALTMMMPVSVRAEDHPELGNQIVPVRINVRLDLDPAERIADIRRQSETTRAEPGLGIIAPFSTLATRLPPAVFAPLYKRGMMGGIDFYTSNLPGPPDHLYIAGARLEHFYAYGPMSNSPINITFMSYAGSLDMALQTDIGAVPDPGALRQCIAEGFDVVAALSSPKAKGARNSKPIPAG